MRKHVQIILEKLRILDEHFGDLDTLKLKFGVLLDHGTCAVAGLTFWPETRKFIEEWPEIYTFNGVKAVGFPIGGIGEYIQDKYFVWTNPRRHLFIKYMIERFSELEKTL